MTAAKDREAPTVTDEQAAALDGNPGTQNGILWKWWMGIRWLLGLGRLETDDLSLACPQIGDRMTLEELPGWFWV